MSEFPLRFSKHYSFGVADAILALLQANSGVVRCSVDDEWLESYGIECTAKAWDNCREQGYILHVCVGADEILIAFGQERRSDNATLWHRRGFEVFPEGEWENETFSDIGAAADRIRELICAYTEEILLEKTPDRRAAVEATKNK